MKPRNAEAIMELRDPRQTSLNSTMKQIYSMETQGMYRRMMRIDTESYAKLQDYFQDFKRRTREGQQSFAAIDLINRHRAEGVGVSQQTVDELDDFSDREHQILTLFLDDTDFDYLKMVAKNAGFRKNSAHGLALIAKEML